jgi:hypothetical protein
LLDVRKARGAAALEFALIAIAFLMLLIGIFEFGRLLFYWNAMSEATRMGARMAVVCTKDDPNIVGNIGRFLPSSLPVSATVRYWPDGCSASDCQFVNVSINPGASVSTIIPFVSIAPYAPSFSTTLPRESMDSSGGNPTCVQKP